MSAAGTLPLKSILAQVSRSFYLSLRLLPRPTRESISLAYLLARLTDTVADTRIVARDQRLELLRNLRGVCLGEASGAQQGALTEELARWASEEGSVSSGERALLRELPRCLELLAEQPELERDLIRQVLTTITEGQIDDLVRFPGDKPEGMAWFETRGELDHYCYQVAGCVGEFWSRLHAARLPSLGEVDLEPWCEQGRRFGRALQLTNVLRDVERDLRHGRCYLPRAELEKHHLAPADLLKPDSWVRLRPLYRELVGQAVSDAQEGLEHTLVIPSHEVSLRLAGLLPLLLSLQTLGLTWAHNPLDPDSRRKVSRRAVYWALVRGYFAARRDGSLRKLFERTLNLSGLSQL